MLICSFFSHFIPVQLTPGSLSCFQTFCAIFTSPSSADAFEEETEEGAKRKTQKTSRQKKATRKSVSGKLNMTEVTPRSIAYAAVMVCYA